MCWHSVVYYSSPHAEQRAYDRFMNQAFQLRSKRPITHGGMGHVQAPRLEERTSYIGLRTIEATVKLEIVMRLPTVGSLCGSPRPIVQHGRATRVLRLFFMGGQCPTLAGPTFEYLTMVVAKRQESAG